MKKTEHRFGVAPPLALRLEEELLLVDERRLLAPRCAELLEALPARVREQVSPGLFAAQVVVGVDVDEGVGDAIAQLSEVRRQVVSAGFGLIGAGLHPRGGFPDAPIIPRPGSLPLLAHLSSLLRTPPCALRIEVALPGPDVAFRVAEGVRQRLPVLQALTANSPFWHGVDSGAASTRAVVLQSQPLEDWDVRVRSERGTLEVGALDGQPTAARAVAVAALVQALVAREVEEPLPPLPSPPLTPADHRRAAQDGMAAELCRPGGSVSPAADVVAETLMEARPYARELGTESALDTLEAVIADGNGADEQRSVYGALGMPGLLGHLARRSEALA